MKVFSILIMMRSSYFYDKKNYLRKGKRFRFRCFLLFFSECISEPLGAEDGRIKDGQFSSSSDLNK